MGIKSIIAATCTCLTIVSFNASAVVVNANWKTAGDNLLTHDLVTGLHWLDLTETNNLSHDYVLTQFGSGGDFEGFRYASIAEVVDLWANFGIELKPHGSYSLLGHDPKVVTATSFIGNIFCEGNCSYYPYGAWGMTNDLTGGNGNYRIMGAYHEQPPTSSEDRTRYVGYSYDSPTRESDFFGHYLVLDTTVVPVPAAVWLFGSGLISLIGFARRKKV